MPVYGLKNEKLTIRVNSFGAELKSIRGGKGKKEYMWQGKPEFWARTSPILFPIVGGLKGKEYKYEGDVFKMSQHGFARDMDFNLESESKDKLLFSLDSSERTYGSYPFHFRLEIEYELRDSTVSVIWRVLNRDQKTMYFSIGGHPGFVGKADNYLKFDVDGDMTSSRIGKEGLLSDEKEVFHLHEQMLPVKKTLFDKDALIFENNQAHKVSLLDADQKPYLTVAFDAPLFGIWAPPRKKVPFICIEPWYGRCDSENFEGGLEDRTWGNQLEPGKEFSAEYTITIED